MTRAFLCWVQERDHECRNCISVPEPAKDQFKVIRIDEIFPANRDRQIMRQSVAIGGSLLLRRWESTWKHC
jgi:hypothetical protein